MSPEHPGRSGRGRGRGRGPGRPERRPEPRADGRPEPRAEGWPEPRPGLRPGERPDPRAEGRPEPRPGVRPEIPGGRGRSGPAGGSKNLARRGRSGRRTGRRGSALGPLLRVAAVVVGLALAVGVASTIRPPVPAAAGNDHPRTVPISSATLVCPESTYAKSASSTIATRMTAVSAPADLPGGAGAGRLDVLPLGSPKPTTSADRREHLARVDVRAPKLPPLVTEGTGSLAPGAYAGQTSRSTSGAARGLAETPCVAPDAEFWFVGAGAQIGRHPTLYLTNAEDADARVDVTLFDKRGRIVDDQTRGLDVRPHTQKVMPLDKLAPTSDRLAVRVTASRGRIAAALHDTREQAGRPAGVDWIPASVTPAKRLVVPGIAPGAGKRVLSVVNPGTTTAVVDISMLGNSGTFQPSRNGRMEIAPGAVGEVDMATASAREATGLRIDSDVPVTASLRNEVTGGSSTAPTGEIAYVPASVPLTGPAVVPDTIGGGSGRAATLQLSTVDRKPASAKIIVQAGDGTEIMNKALEVAAGGTAQLRLPTSQGDKGYLIVVRPDPGSRLFGVRLVTEDVQSGPDKGPMISAWPLRSAPDTAIRPVVLPDLGVR